MKTDPQHILISRTDAIGDVMLTLPAAGYLKKLFPQSKISFLGRDYTAPVIKDCSAVDEFISYDEIKALPDAEQITCFKKKKIEAIVHVFPNKHVAQLAKKAGVKLRIGTTNRLYHWLTCNKLVKLSRKKSDLHEAQLNLILLKPLGLGQVPDLASVNQHYFFQDPGKLPAEVGQLLSEQKFNLVIHPKSHGSGAEWGLDKFSALINLLPPQRFNIIVTGSEKEMVYLADWLKKLPAHVVNLTGRLTLTELISLIFQTDGLIASGTGPLHIAAAAGINTLGLFPSVRPIHPGRWAPVGEKATYIESGTGTLDTISVHMVLNKIDDWI
ncbi:glycosyltransferase family 9 protein [Mucilaginibacter litoreus]|uniref:Glycosyltransferase family 9 protein n=1 Tax=Mucilaginibacter litoreus TaxID=1048221 RepID=A0ABW3AXW7_9SPHI